MLVKHPSPLTAIAAFLRLLCVNEVSRSAVAFMVPSLGSVVASSKEQHVGKCPIMFPDVYDNLRWVSGPLRSFSFEVDMENGKAFLSLIIIEESVGRPDERSPPVPHGQTLQCCFYEEDGKRYLRYHVTDPEDTLSWHYTIGWAMEEAKPGQLLEAFHDIPSDYARALPPLKEAKFGQRMRGRYEISKSGQMRVEDGKLLVPVKETISGRNSAKESVQNELQFSAPIVKYKCGKAYFLYIHKKDLRPPGIKPFRVEEGLWREGFWVHENDLSAYKHNHPGGMS